MEHEYLNPDSFVRWNNYPSVKKYEEEWDKRDAENQHLDKLSHNSGNCPYCKRCNRTVSYTHLTLPTSDLV